MDLSSIEHYTHKCYTKDDVTYVAENMSKVQNRTNFIQAFKIKVADIEVTLKIKKIILQCKFCILTH